MCLCFSVLFFLFIFLFVLCFSLSFFVFSVFLCFSGALGGGLRALNSKFRGCASMMCEYHRIAGTTGPNLSIPSRDWATSLPDIIDRAMPRCTFGKATLLLFFLKGRVGKLTWRLKRLPKPRKLFALSKEHKWKFVLLWRQKRSWKLGECFHLVKKEEHLGKLVRRSKKRPETRTFTIHFSVEKKTSV